MAPKVAFLTWIVRCRVGRTHKVGRELVITAEMHVRDNCAVRPGDHLQAAHLGGAVRDRDPSGEDHRWLERPVIRILMKRYLALQRAVGVDALFHEEVRAPDGQVGADPNSQRA